MSLAVFSFGYFESVLNLSRGIKNDGYSITEAGVYYNGKKIKEADKETFTPITFNKKHENGDDYIIKTRYAKDHQHVFYYKDIVQGASPDDFSPVDLKNLDAYWKDEKSIFLSGKVLPGANEKNFKFLNAKYGPYMSVAIDDQVNLVYHNDKIIADADASTFEIVISLFYKDNQNIYDGIYLKKVMGIDVASFRVIENSDHYITDKNGLYEVRIDSKEEIVRALKIEGAGHETFRSLDRGYYKDEFRVYWISHQGTRVKGVPKTKVLKNVDYATFTVTGYDQATKSEAKDKNHRYLDGEIVK